MLRKILLIGLVATSLVAISETETRAVINIGGTGASGCFCVSSTGSCKSRTSCDRSRDLGTCDDFGTTTYCPIASLEKSEFFAAAPGQEQTEICADAPIPEPVATFADTPSPEQIATIAAPSNSEPMIILAAKPTPSIEPAPSAYECFSFGAGAGNLDNNPAATSCAFRPEQVAVHCQNPAGQDGGLGTPFSPSVTLSGTDVFDESNLAGRGKWFADSLYTQADLFAVISVGPDVCKSNWSVIPNSLTILEVTTDVKTNRCSDGSTPENCENSLIQPPDDRWISNCTIAANNTTFNCTVVVHCLDLDGAARDACLTQIY